MMQQCKNRLEEANENGTYASRRALTAKVLSDGYSLEELIGHGAMGNVWRGTRSSDSQPVAIKLLRPELAEDPDVIARFRREGALMLAINHPCVVRVLDVIAEGNDLAIVMDLIDGGDLRTYLESLRTLRPTEALLLTGQVCAGLAAVHAAGIIHRDLKPENILIDTSGSRGPVARLTDFGIGRFTSAPTVTSVSGIIGTPQYLAPELIERGTASARSDLYSVGIVLYELLTGKVPFSAPHPVAVLRRHLESSPERPAGIQDGVWRLLSRLLEKRPEHRPDSAAAIARECAALAFDLREVPALARGVGGESSERETAVPVKGIRNGQEGLERLVNQGFLDPKAETGTVSNPPLTSLAYSPKAAPPLTAGGSAPLKDDAHRAIGLAKLSAAALAVAVATVIALKYLPGKGSPEQRPTRLNRVDQIDSALRSMPVTQLGYLTRRTQLLALTSSKNYLIQRETGPLVGTFPEWAARNELESPLPTSDEYDWDLQDPPAVLAKFPQFPRLYRGLKLMKVIESGPRTFLTYGAPQTTSELSHTPPVTDFLVSMDRSTHRPRYVLDLNRFQDNATEPNGPFPLTTAVRWAAEAGDLLLMDTNRGIIALDRKRMEVIWRSDPLATGSGNFVVFEDLLISAEGPCECDAILEYGLFVSDLETGAVLDSLYLPEPAEWLAVKENRLFVRGDAEYVFDIRSQ